MNFPPPITNHTLEGSNVYKYMRMTDHHSEAGAGSSCNRGPAQGAQEADCTILPAAKWLGKRRAAAAEAEHVAALTRGTIAVLMRDMVAWAQSQPAWANGHARNADGAGAAMEQLHTVTPTRFRTSGRPVDFIGSLVAPEEEGGKGHMETSLQLEPAVAARAARL